MRKGLVRRLVSAILLALVAAGGGRLSTVDALGLFLLHAKSVRESHSHSINLICPLGESS